MVRQWSLFCTKSAKGLCAFEGGHCPQTSLKGLAYVFRHAKYSSTARNNPSIGKISIEGAVRHIAWLLLIPLWSISCGAHAEQRSHDSAPRSLPSDTSVRSPQASPVLRPEDLGPMFDQEPLRSAFEDVAKDRGSRAISTLNSWIRANPTSSRGPYARFGLAYAYVQAEEWEESVPWLRMCVTELPILSDYCSYWLGLAHMELESYNEGIAHVSTVAEDAVYGPRSQFLKARLMLRAGNAAGAIDELNRFIERYPYAFYRSDVDMELAEAHIALEQWGEAASLLYRLEMQNPGRSIERDAKSRRESIMDELSEEVSKRFKRTSARSRIERAEALFKRHRSKQVIEQLDPIVGDLRVDSREACEANLLIARSLTKLRQHTNAAPYYDAVIDNCSDVDQRRVALYNAGRAYWNAGKYDTARARYKTMYEDYADHSYADDGMHYSALILRNEGKIEESNALLQEQVRRWPDGDMAKDAIWIQMRDLLDAKAWADAVTYADSLKGVTGEDDIYSRGRVQYFRGRALEEQSKDIDASISYQRVIRDYPLSWYALLSFNRLGEIDTPAVGRLVDELRQTASIQSAVLILDPPELADDDFMTRGRIFLRLGFVELASAEFSKLEDRYAARTSVSRIVARLLDAAKAWDVSHRAGASRITNPDHYPAPDSIDDWTVAYPKPFDDHVTHFADERGLDPFLIDAVMREESGFNPTIESWANALGLMQLMVPTAQDMARRTGRGKVSERELLEPEINIELGSMYLLGLAERFEGHPVCMIAGYNGGTGNVRRWLRERGDMAADMWVETIPYTQTRHYVKRVAMSWWIYHWLYDLDTPVVGIPFELPEP